MLTFDIAGAQIDGARDYQEDAFLVTRIGDSSGKKGVSLIIVADGMGGHAAGNVASNMAVQTFNKHLTSAYPTPELAKALRAAVLQANNSIAETVRETAALKGMGCTLVATVIDDKQFRWASVGDSHIYLVRNGELLKQNADHSYGGFLARMAAQGKNIEPEAGFSRNMLMSALTGDEIAEIDCPEKAVELQGGDRLIIASDGLDTLSTSKILSFVNKADSAKACVDAVLKGVQDARMPRQDNTTVVVVMIGEQAEYAARPAPPPAAQLEAPPPLAPPRPAVRPLPPPKPLPKAQQEKGRGLGLAVLAFVCALGGAGWLLFGEDLRHSVEPSPPTPAIARELPADSQNPGQKPPPVAQESPAIATGKEPPVPVQTRPTEEPVEVVTPPPQPVVVQPGEVFKEGPGPEMVWLPAGRFTMGSAGTSDAFDERPAREVQIARFAISTHEVTAEEYARFAGASAKRLPGANIPATFVSWDNALAYTRWLSRQTGKRYRLPSESEWEYAARAGTVTPYWWGRSLGEGRAHCFACGTALDPRRPTQVGRFPPNPFGLYDTVGNVEEWVHDCVHPSYEGAPEDGSVFEGGDCTHRIVRGGAFSSGPQGLRVTTRGKFLQSAANDGLGFRVVREP